MRLSTTPHVHRKYFDSRRPKGPEYRAQTVHGLGRVPAYVESCCKAFLPMIAISLELYFAHKGGWRTMVCPAGTPRAGHFYGPHMGNWQHASMYPPFILAGACGPGGTGRQQLRGFTPRTAASPSGYCNAAHCRTLLLLLLLLLLAVPA